MWFINERRYTSEMIHIELNLEHLQEILIALEADELYEPTIQLLLIIGLEDYGDVNEKYHIKVRH